MGGLFDGNDSECNMDLRKGRSSISRSPSRKDLVLKFLIIGDYGVGESLSLSPLLSASPSATLSLPLAPFGFRQDGHRPPIH